MTKIKLHGLLILCAVAFVFSVQSQQVPQIPFVVVPLGGNSWALNQVYLREQLVNTNLVGIGLSNFVQLMFRNQLTNVNRQEQLNARQLTTAFDTSTNKVVILQLLGVGTNTVSPADLQ